MTQPFAEPPAPKPQYGLMTGREAASLALVLLGFIAAVVAAVAFDWRAGLATLGVGLVALGVLLGLDS